MVYRGELGTLLTALYVETDYESLGKFLAQMIGHGCARGLLRRLPGRANRRRRSRCSA